ncbi:hypothetical protein MP228_005279 [Amoeboaphelidium protococcarum]|nr:hypothetical protein MP228_005279 [Amoeboaphelidium protococcarum]
MRRDDFRPPGGASGRPPPRPYMEDMPPPGEFQPEFVPYDQQDMPLPPPGAEFEYGGYDEQMPPPGPGGPPEDPYFAPYGPPPPMGGAPFEEPYRPPFRPRHQGFRGRPHYRPYGGGGGPDYYGRPPPSGPYYGRHRDYPPQQFDPYGPPPPHSHHPYTRGYGYGPPVRRRPPPRYREPNPEEEELKKQSTTLWIGNLPYDYLEPQLVDMFEQYGNIVKITVPIDRFTQKNKGFGFVQFERRSDAEKAFDGVKEQEVEGRRVRVDWDIGMERKGIMDVDKRPAGVVDNPNEGVEDCANPQQRDRSRSPQARDGNEGGGYRAGRY